MPRAVPLMLAVVLLLPTVASTASVDDDCGLGHDAPDGGRGARIEAPLACDATFGPDDERDVYRFDIPHGMRAHVSATPATDGQRGVVCLFPPGWVAAATCADKLDFTGYDPREWSVGVYLCATSACAAFGRGAYTLDIRLAGAESPRTHHEGRVLLGAAAPLASANRALGPGPADGIDGAWHDMPEPTESRDFVRVTTAACSDCLTLTWQFAGGGVAGASCSRTAPHTLDCRAPTNATRIMVGATAGHVDVAYTVTVWSAREAFT